MTARPAGGVGGAPLSGRRVVVTRAEAQAPALARRLHRLGAETVELPTIVFADPVDGGAALRAAAAGVAAYEWVVFTSATAVERFLPLLGDARSLRAARVAAIGSATAEALRRWHVVADLVPERFVAESLLEAFPPPPGPEAKVLLPRAAVARDVLPDGLRAAGWHVEVVEAYRTERVEPPSELLAAAATADAVAFTSSSTVTGYVEAVGTGAVPPVVACIGPVTADTARRHGLRVDVVAEVHTLDGLVEALVAALGP